MTVAFKLINKLALARDVFFRQGDVLFCECKMSFKNGPVHYTPADFMFYPYIAYISLRPAGTAFQTRALQSRNVSLGYEARLG